MGDFIINILNYIISGLANVLLWIIGLLPSSPFKYLENTDIAKYLNGLNWVFPFDFMITTGEVWLVAVGCFYLYQVILRWVRAIG